MYKRVITIHRYSGSLFAAAHLDQYTEGERLLHQFQLIHTLQKLLTVLAIFSSLRL